MAAAIVTVNQGAYSNSGDNLAGNVTLQGNNASQESDADANGGDAVGFGQHAFGFGGGDHVRRRLRPPARPTRSAGTGGEATSGNTNSGSNTSAATNSITTGAATSSNTSSLTITQSQTNDSTNTAEATGDGG